MTYVPATFEVAVYNGLVDEFTRKYIIQHFTFGQGRMKFYPVSSTLCELS